MLIINRVELTGWVQSTPDLRMTKEGKAWCKIDLKIAKKKADANYSYITVMCHDKNAETICRYIKEGMPLYVAGRLVQDNWTDKAGNKRYSYSINLQDFGFMDDQKEVGGAIPASSPSGCATISGPSLEEQVPF